ncbi:MAG TPA: hypothetical protein VNS81_08550 [Nocardioides sp.]|nr:hypothetical protein [Nocardioides sp.]
MTGIQLARFGNKAGAHGLLGHSGADLSLLSDLKWHTDAPPQTDPQRLESFGACYRLHDHYIAQVTSPDLSAPRAGMVTTIAAIIAPDDLARLDLVRLWTYLDAGPPVDVPQDVQRFELAEDEIAHQHPPGAAALADELVRSGKATWVGPGMRSAVACLWRHLTPPNRFHLAVGLAVHPDVVPIPLRPSSIVVMAVPPASADRWTGWGQAGTGTHVADHDGAAQALLGDDGGTSADLARQLDVEPEMRDWRHLAAASSLLATLDTLNHEQVRSLIQLLGLLQPDPRNGGTVRSAVSDRLKQLTPGSPFDDARGLRTLPWASLTEVTLEELVSAWMVSATDGGRYADVVDALAYLAEMPPATSGAPDPFSEHLATVAIELLGPAELKPLMGVLVHRKSGHAIVTWLLTAGISRRSIDIALAAAVQAPGAAGWEGLAASGRLPRTHAAVADVADPSRAWAHHVAISTRPQESDDALAARTTPTGVVAAAIDLGHPDLVERAGALVANGATDLPPGDLSLPNYWAVWESATRQGADPWASVSPAVAAPTIIELLRGDSPPHPVVITALSRTSAADLAQHPDRHHVWALLPDPALPGFLSATAGSVARSLQPDDPAPEHELAAAILKASVLGAVAHESATQALNLLEVIPSANHQHALTVIRRGRFSPAESTRLGQLVVHRRWETVAEAIDDSAQSRNDLNNAAVAVAPMFGLLDRVKRAIRGGRAHLLRSAEATELQDALHDLASRLYPAGPRESGIWERSGGDDADLPTASTGRLQWGHALDAILTGRRGAPTLLDLLAEMRAEFPNNEDVQALARWAEKQGAQ